MMEPTPELLEDAAKLWKAMGFVNDRHGSVRRLALCLAVRDEAHAASLSDAEARIAELEAALDEKEIASGLTSDGNLWRYWAEKAKDLALKNTGLNRELAEARRERDNAQLAYEAMRDHRALKEKPERRPHE